MSFSNSAVAASPFSLWPPTSPLDSSLLVEHLVCKYIPLSLCLTFPGFRCHFVYLRLSALGSE